MDFTVRVKPGSRKGPAVEEAPDDPSVDFVVFVRERAVDGAANAGTLRAIAAHFGIAPSNVHLLRGAGSRIKRIRVDGIA
ncbi:DUF167 domain-containing protein [Agromyces archimandritae]|uniref:DUF167 domain-containing protein n=1 Tax=Agromyces archimandritae TaxID=2781962 RepID=A0A975IQF1_9MICO|nr:DUF167 domain-containing protein [Agromyces archimandritae]QTX04971.1 DUF167 domain-containing protein [Agromyces archimandritae]